VPAALPCARLGAPDAGPAPGLMNLKATGVPVREKSLLLRNINDLMEIARNDSAALTLLRIHTFAI